jgi:hypothetical protein
MSTRAPRGSRLRPRLEAAYQAILAHKAAHDGLNPTLRELGALLNVSSTSLTRYYLHRLVAAGLLAWDGADGRNYRVVGGRWQPPTPPPDVAAAIARVAPEKRIKPPAQPRAPLRALTDAQRLEIRRRLLQGEKPAPLAREFQVSYSMVWRLRDRKTPL